MDTIEERLERIENQQRAQGEQLAQLLGAISLLNNDMAKNMDGLSKAIAEMSAVFSGQLQAAAEQINLLADDVAKAEVAAYGAAQSVAALKLVK